MNPGSNSLCKICKFAYKAQRTRGIVFICKYYYRRSIEGPRRTPRTTYWYWMEAPTTDTVIRNSNVGSTYTLPTSATELNVLGNYVRVSLEKNEIPCSVFILRIDINGRSDILLLQLRSFHSV